MDLFHKFCEQNNIVHDSEAVFKYLSLFERKDILNQLSFFDEIKTKETLKK